MKLEERDQNLTFENIPEGWHKFEIKECQWTKNESGDTTNTLRVVFSCLSAEAEGSQISMFCPLDRKFGRTKLAKILGWSGVAAKIEANKKNIDANLTPSEWGEKYLAPGSEIIGMAITYLPGRKIEGEVRYEAGKDGKTYPAVVGLRSAGASGSKAKVAKPDTEDESEEIDW